MKSVYKFFNWLFKRKPKLLFEGYIKCIDDRDWNFNSQSKNLNYGYVYEIVETWTCPDCKKVFYDIGSRNLIPPSSMYHFFSTHRCETTGLSYSRIPGEGIHWAEKTRFAQAKEGDFSKHRILEKLNNSLGKTGKPISENPTLDVTIENVKKELGLK
jgi:hypothetical protein